MRPAEVEEVAEGDPRDVVVENALRKARAVPGARVLGSDTVVAIGGEVLGKPADRDQATDYLERLSGAEHRVWSSVALVAGDDERAEATSAGVRFRELSAPDLDWYLDTGEWEGRAGGYAVQGRGAALVESVEGDYNCVVGLPVALLLSMAPDLIHP